MKIIILILLLFSSAIQARNEFYQAFDIDMSPYQQTADRLANYYSGKINLDTREQINELEALSHNINAYLQSTPNHPGLHFLKGLNASFLSGLYKQSNDDASFTSSIQVKINEYQEAMRLDTLYEPHLSAAIYATMKHGLPEDLKIQAIQKELKLGGNGEDESYYWFLHWSNINALQQAGRHEEAQAAVKAMQEELDKSDFDKSQYQAIVERASEELNKPKPVTKSQPVIENTTQPKQKHKNRSNKDIIIWAIVISAISALVLVMIYELVIRKRK